MAQDSSFAQFEFSDVDAQRSKANQPYIEFLRRPSMHCGVYHLEAGSEDPQSPHDDDELYYVQSGRAKFFADGKNVDVKPGTLLYVKAHEEHRFHSIEENLTILVFFSTSKAHAGG